VGSPIIYVIGRNETDKLNIAFTIAKQEENAMPQIGIRITHELHGQIQDTADEQNISISDFVRHAVAHLLNGCQPPLNSANQELVSHLQHEVQEKNDQIRELHQLLGIAQNNVSEMSKQLEDHRINGKWWHFWRKNALH